MRILLLTTVSLISIMGNLGSSPTLSDHQIKGWKVYHNQRLGFSIKYPPSWEADGSEGEHNPIVIIYRRRPKPHEFYITVSIEHRTLGEIRESFTEFTRKSPASQFAEREILFSNQKAYQFTRSDNRGFYAVYIPFHDKLYAVSAARFDIPEVRRAVGTFEFSEQRD